LGAFCAQKCKKICGNCGKHESAKMMDRCVKINLLSTKNVDKKRSATIGRDLKKQEFVCRK
jgi:hypothetical protein